MYCPLMKVKHTFEQAHIWTSPLSSCVPSVPYYHVCLTTSTIIEKNRMICLDQQMSASVSWGNNAVAGLWHVTLWYAVPGALFSRCLLQFHEGTILWLACSWPMTGVVVWCTVLEQLYKIQLRKIQLCKIQLCKIQLCKIQLCKIQLCKIQLLWQCECSASCSLWMLEDTSYQYLLCEWMLSRLWVKFECCLSSQLTETCLIWCRFETSGRRKSSSCVVCFVLEQP